MKTLLDQSIWTKANSNGFYNTFTFIRQSLVLYIHLNRPENIRRIFRNRWCIFNYNIDNLIYDILNK